MMVLAPSWILPGARRGPAGRVTGTVAACGPLASTGTWHARGRGRCPYRIGKRSRTGSAVGRNRGRRCRRTRAAQCRRRPFEGLEKRLWANPTFTKKNENKRNGLKMIFRRCTMYRGCFDGSGPPWALQVANAACCRRARARALPGPGPRDSSRPQGLRDSDRDSDLSASMTCHLVGC
jgi:hypothetical protein